jgi:hypothetical protein
MDFAKGSTFKMTESRGADEREVRQSCQESFRNMQVRQRPSGLRHQRDELIARQLAKCERSNECYEPEASLGRWRHPWPTSKTMRTTSRATAHLPGLEIEIVHRRPADNVEQISIDLQAAPSFEASRQPGTKM